MFIKVDKDEFNATLSYLEKFGEVRMFADYGGDQNVVTEYTLGSKVIGQQWEQEESTTYEINPDIYASYRLSRLLTDLSL